MLSSLDVSIICKVQGDIPIVPEPYKQMAEELGISQEELLDKISKFSKSGIMRRFGAILNHRNAGYKANAMVVWNVPEKKVKEATDIMITFQEVSHCYKRPTSVRWPYNIFTMIHGDTRNRCEEVIEKISNLININDYNILYSVHEFKKVSMRYFEE